MSDAPQRSYGGRSAEARRQQRRARLLDAALDVMADDEWRTATVDRLCGTAGLNKRYFYESFSDLDSVAEAVVDDIAEAVRTATLLAVAEDAAEPLEQQAVSAVKSVVRTLVGDPRRARVLLGGVAASPAVHQHRSTVLVALTAVLIGHARTVHDLELEQDPLAQVAPAFIIGGTADAILGYVDGRLDVSEEQLVGSLAELWLISGNGAADAARKRLSG